MSDSVWPHRQQPTRLLHSWDSPGKNTGVGCHLLLQCMKVKSESEVAQSCPTLSDPMDWSLPGSSIHEIFQARVLEWGAIAFSILNIRPTLFRTHKLSLFEIVKDTQCTCLLLLLTHNWLKKKREIQINKSLIASIKDNHVLVDQSFYSGPSGTKSLSIKLCKLYISPIGKLQKNFLHSHGKDLYQVLLINICVANSKE